MAAADNKGNSETDLDIEFGKTNANDEAIHVTIPAAMWTQDAIASRRRWIIGGAG